MQEARIQQHWERMHEMLPGGAALMLKAARSPPGPRGKWRQEDVVIQVIPEEQNCDHACMCVFARQLRYIAKPCPLCSKPTKQGTHLGMLQELMGMTQAHELSWWLFCEVRVVDQGHLYVDVVLWPGAWQQVDGMHAIAVELDDSSHYHGTERWLQNKDDLRRRKRIAWGDMGFNVQQCFVVWDDRYSWGQRQKLLIDAMQVIVDVSS